MVRISKAREYLEVRGRKIFIFLADVHFREMLVRFSAKDVRACPLLHTDPFMAWSATLIGRIEQSSPKAAQWRVVDAGLYGKVRPIEHRYAVISASSSQHKRAGD